MTPRADRPLDLVLFGATSFVGRIITRHLVERHGPDGTTGPEGPVRWAIAGRNATKLADLARACGATVEAIVVDATDPDALAAVADRTRTIASTVGPYARYGSPLVAAVAAAGTDYLDLTGEPHWMRHMIDAHQDQAAASGARIVHACGFDSIPSDLGVHVTQRRAQEVFGRPCTAIEMRVHTLKGGASGGTVASMLDLVEAAAHDKELRALLADPYALTPADFRHGPTQPDTRRPARDDDGTWRAPFVMAAVNTRIVHRSHALLGRPWGPEFRYDEALTTGSGPAGAAKAAAVTAAMGGGMALAALGPAKGLVRRVVPDPGTGPSPEAQRAGSFDLRFTGTTDDGRVVRTRVTGDRDPGYGSTAKMFGETAVALSRRSPDDLPGGFWTPATAFGDALVERLEAHAGLRFDVTEP